MTWTHPLPLVLLFALLGGCSCASAPPRPPPANLRRAVPADGEATRIVPADRRTTWNPGVPGGIPRATAIHTTIDAALGDGVADATEAIETALEAAADAAERSGEIQVVALPPGTFRTTREIVIGRSRVVLRGAGKGRTILQQSTPGVLTLFLGSSSPDYRSTPVVDVVGSVPRGATEITVADASGFAAGDILQLDQLEDGDPQGRTGSVWRLDIWWSMRGPYAEHPGMGLESRFPDSPDGARPIAQRVEVKAIRGDVLELSGPVHVDFAAAQHPQVYRAAGAGHDVVRWAGFEDLTVRGTMRDGEAKPMIVFDGAAYCWLRGVESDGQNGFFLGKHVVLGTATYRCEVRESYVHHSRNLWPGANAYGIVYSGSDCLIEDNVAYALNKPIVGETTGGGNVIAYNYVDEAVLGALDGAWQETAIDASHGSFSHSDLFEGNWAPNLSTDATHGNNGWMTFFRNHATGRNTSGRVNGNLRAIEVAGRNREHTSIGNVLLTPEGARDAVLLATPSRPNLGLAVYRLGANTWDASGSLAFGNWDDGQAARLFHRHLDFDYASGGVYDNPENGVKALPDSLYLRAKPAFFGSLEWPWVDPLGTTPAERVKTLPAKARFDAGRP